MNWLAPPTLTKPLSLILPPAVTVKPPEILEGPRPKALTSFNVTALPLTILTAPPKSSALLKVTLLAVPAVRVVLPVTATAALSPMAPLAVMLKSPEIVNAGTVMAAPDTRVRPPEVIGPLKVKVPPLAVRLAKL